MVALPGRYPGIPGSSHLHRCGRTPLPPLRHRHHHKPHPRLRLAHRDARFGLRRLRHRLAVHLARPHWGRVPARYRRFDAGGGGTLQPFPSPRPGFHRQAFLQTQVRREKDPRRVLCEATRGDGHRRPELRATRNGTGDGAARARLALAAGTGESRMRAHRLAWALWILTMLCSVLSLPLAEQGSLIVLVPLAAWTLTSSTVGTIIVSRRPENPIGWILCAIGFLWACNIFSGLYGIQALVTDPGSLPAGEVAAWVGTWVVYPAFGLLAYLFLLFPDGRPLSPRWHPLLWTNSVLIVVGSAVWAFTPGPIAGLEGIRNPLGIEGYGVTLEFAGQLFFYAV